MNQRQSECMRAINLIGKTIAVVDDPITARVVDVSIRPGTPPFAVCLTSDEARFLVSPDKLRVIRARRVPCSDGACSSGNISPDKIKSMLAEAGVKQADLAASCRCSRGNVADVISGAKTNARVARAISEAIGIPTSELWPGRYRRLETTLFLMQQEQAHA